MKKVLFILSILISVMAFAQSPLEKADAKFEKLEYSFAAEAYEDFLQDNEGDAYATLRLAICYKMMNNATKAAFYFEQAIYASDSEPSAKLFYAQTLAQLGQYNKAKKYYEEYKNWFPEDNKADLGIASCNEALAIKSRPALFTVNNVKSLNSKANDFAAITMDNKVVFSSDRNSAYKIDYTYGWTGEGFLDNYQSTLNEEGQYSTPEMSDRKDNSVYHDATMAFSSNGKVAAFSRNQFKDNIVGGSIKKSSADEVVKLKIMLRENTDGKWSAPFEASFNDPEFSFTHPTFSLDGKTLFFVSDMPGGYGGTDIWMAKLTADMVFEKPINLGAGVNTSGNEMYPFIANDGALYFASNGHPGLGGLDVFRAEKGNKGLFNSPYNLGSPLNSSRDDFAFSMGSNKKGFVSSNREGGLGGDDIYSIELTGLFGKVNVVNGITNKLIADADVCVSVNSVEKYKLRSNQNGVLYIPFSVNQRYELHVCNDEFRSENLLVNTFGKEPGTWIEETILVYPQFRSYVSGFVLEEKSKLPIGNSKVVFINGNTGKSQELITDQFGFYKFEVFPNVNEYILIASQEGYTDDKISFNTLNMVKEENRKVNLLLSGGEVICKLPFRDVYFDYNKANIRDEASVDLNRMLDILNYSDKLKVQIAAHTDSRGTDEYNLRLSDRRAQSIVKWLVAKGIDKSRLQAKGYGEFELSNQCGNDVECSEEEHQANRRVEFKVLDENGAVICESIKI